MKGFFFSKQGLLCMWYMHVCVCACVYAVICAHKGQRRKPCAFVYCYPSSSLESGSLTESKTHHLKGAGRLVNFWGLPGLLFNTGLHTYIGSAPHLAFTWMMRPQTQLLVPTKQGLSHWGISPSLGVQFGVNNCTV